MSSCFADFSDIRETLELIDDVWSAEAELDRGEFTTQDKEGALFAPPDSGTFLTHWGTCP